MAATNVAAAAALLCDPPCLDTLLSDWSFARVEPCRCQRVAKLGHKSASHATAVPDPTAAVLSRRRALLHVAHHPTRQAAL